MGLSLKGLEGAGAYTSIGAAVTVLGQRGGVATYTGVGDCDVTLDKGIDINECAILCNLLNAAANDHTIRIVHTSDTVKQVLPETTAAAAAAEQAVNWLAIRFAP